MAEVLRRTIKEAKDMVSKVSRIIESIPGFVETSRMKMSTRFQTYIFFRFFRQKKVQANECVVLPIVQEAINILRGAVTIVYPMGLPPHDPVRCEFENTEDLSGTQVCSWRVLQLLQLNIICNIVNKPV